MNFHIVEPTGLLKNYIRHYCFMESDRFEDDVTERVIPTESIQLMFHYRNPFVVYHHDGLPNKQPRSVISGLCDSYSDVSTFGEAGVVFVTFHPYGACHFFDFPLSAIENKSIDLADIFNAEVRQLEETLFLKKTLTERVPVIENFLIKHFAPIPSHDHLIIQKGMALIRQCKGQTTAGVLSDRLSTTPKSLERKFSRYLGKTTKQVMKLVRFQEVVSGLSSDRISSLTDLAYRHGYFDQAHFIKDFKAYAGFSPKEFVARYNHASARIL